MTRNETIAPAVAHTFLHGLQSRASWGEVMSGERRSLFCSTMVDASLQLVGLSGTPDLQSGSGQAFAVWSRMV